MNIVEWTRDLVSGFDSIDEQHRQFFDLTNALNNAHEQGDKAAVTQIYADLQSLAEAHFTDEEALMELAGYHLLARHRQMHQRFLAKIMAQAKAWQDGEDKVDDSLLFLQSWAFSHLGHADKAYVPVVREAMAAMQE